MSCVLNALRSIVWMTCVWLRWPIKPVRLFVVNAVRIFCPRIPWLWMTHRLRITFVTVNCLWWWIFGRRGAVRAR